MLKTVIVGTFVLAAVACGQPATPTSDRSEVPRAGEHGMKGWELYSWVDERGEWRFSLLVGTNALRPLDAVSAPEHAQDVASIERALAELAPGEEIVWPGPSVRHAASSASTVRFAMPDAATRSRIERAARDRGLALEIVE